MAAAFQGQQVQWLAQHRLTAWWQLGAAEAQMPTCPCGYSRPKLAYSLRRSSRVSSVPMLFSVMLSARRSACVDREGSVSKAAC